MSIRVLPTTSRFPAYQMQFALDGRRYIVLMRWNTRDQAWSMDWLTRTRDPLLRGIKIVYGVELMQRFAIGRLPDGEMYATRLGGNRDRPMRFAWNDDAVLTFVPRGFEFDG